MDALIEGDRRIIPENKIIEIQQEFAELFDKKNVAAVLSMDKDIIYLRNKLYIIEFSVDVMRKHYSSKVAELLNFYGFNYDWEDIPNLDKNLDRVLNRSKSEYLELKQKEEFKEKHLPEVDATSEQMYDFFNTWLGVISDEAGYPITAEKIKVAEFCRRCCNLQAKVQTWQTKAVK